MTTISRPQDIPAQRTNKAPTDLTTHKGGTAKSSDRDAVVKAWRMTTEHDAHREQPNN